MKIYFRTFAATNPVFLHGLNFVWPVERINFVEQFIGIGGNFEEPLLHLFLFDFVATAPTFAILDLLVCKYGLIHWAPPLIALCLVGKPLFEELQEAPLSPLIVFWVGGIYFARPVDRIAKALCLLAEVINICFSDFLWRNAGFDGIIFGRKAKSIIAKWAQDVHFLLRIEASETINDGEIANMSNVETGARWIWEHLREEHLGTLIVVFGGKRFFFFPTLLPFFFYFQWIIMAHNFYILPYFLRGVKCLRFHTKSIS